MTKKLALTPERRSRLYAVLTVAVPLVVFYGVLSETEASMWLAFAAALLGSGGNLLAGWHVPDAPDYVGRHRSGE